MSDSEGCVVEDLNSTNGILIGDNRVKKYRLQDGDVISIGVHELVYTDLRKAETDDVAESTTEEAVGGPS
jgi:pSer/pThr/pTyr-binding forkhead associated (FHA) protein